MSETNGTVASESQVVAIQQALKVFQSVISSRAEWASRLGMAFGGKRDYYETLGYEHVITPEMYWERFERQDIASRIVTAYPDETWRLEPNVYEDETENDTPFLAAWKAMSRRLRVFHNIHRADILACLGRFSLLFLGFNDVSTVEGLEREVTPAEGRSIGYLSSYGERHIEIVEIDGNVASPRFGLPLIYEIDFDRSGSDKQRTQRFQSSVGKRRVHWSRVIHLADNVLEDDIYGIPKLRPVFNLLADNIKVVGGGAETFWRNARKDLIIEADADAHLSEASLALLREKAEEYVHDLNRVLGLEGATGKTFPVEVASPEGHFNVIMQLISGVTGIPVRILLGSERGELASSQDAVNWAQKNETRQVSYAETVLRAFIDRCINYRVLPTPKMQVDGYTIEWQPLITEDPGEQADTLLKRVNAMNSYANGAAPVYFPPQEVRELEFRLDAESPYESEEAIDARESANDDDPPVGDEPVEDAA